MSELDRAMRDWQHEVERVAADLIRRGVPPYDAVERARNIVATRREAAALAQPHVGERCKRCGRVMKQTKDGVAYCDCWMPQVDETKLDRHSEEQP